VADLHHVEALALAVLGHRALVVLVGGRPVDRARRTCRSSSAYPRRSAWRALRLAPVINFNTIPVVTADRFDGTHLSAQGYGKETTVARQVLVGV